MSCAQSFAERFVNLFPYAVKISIMFTFLANPTWWVVPLVTIKGVVNPFNLLFISESPDGTSSIDMNKCLNCFSDLIDF